MAEASKGFDLKSLEAKIALLFFAFFVLLILTPKSDTSKNEEPIKKPPQSLACALGVKPENVQIIIADLTTDAQKQLLIKCAEETRKAGRSLTDKQIYEIAEYDHAVYLAYKRWYDYAIRYYSNH